MRTSTLALVALATGAAVPHLIPGARATPVCVEGLAERWSLELQSVAHDSPAELSPDYQWPELGWVQADGTLLLGDGDMWSQEPDALRLGGSWGEES